MALVERDPGRADRAGGGRAAPGHQPRPARGRRGDLRHRPLGRCRRRRRSGWRRTACGCRRNGTVAVDAGLRAAATRHPRGRRLQRPCRDGAGGRAVRPDAGRDRRGPGGGRAAVQRQPDRGQLRNDPDRGVRPAAGGDRSACRRRRRGRPGTRSTVYRTSFRPMFHTLTGGTARTMMKLVVDKATDRVLGCHMVGEDAAEMIQGFAVALTAGATKRDIRRHRGAAPDRGRGIRHHVPAAQRLILTRDEDDGARLAARFLARAPRAADAGLCATRRRWPRSRASSPPGRRWCSRARRARSRSGWPRSAPARASCSRAATAPRRSPTSTPTRSAIPCACCCRWRWC